MAKTIEQLIDELEEALDYWELNDVTKAKKVVTAAMQLAVRRPTSASQDASSAGYDSETLGRIIKQAQDFVQLNAGGGVRFLGPTTGFGRG